MDERLTLLEKLRSDGTVELDYELDLDYEEFEEFQLPQISHGRYLHDFKANQTAIIDPEGGRCFVTPLDQEEVPRPRSFYEIIRNLRDGVYGLDVAEVRMDTRVVLPPVGNAFEFGSVGDGQVIILCSIPHFSICPPSASSSDLRATATPRTGSSPSTKRCDSSRGQAETSHPF